MELLMVRFLLPLRKVEGTLIECITSDADGKLHQLIGY